MVVLLYLNVVRVATPLNVQVGVGGDGEHAALAVDDKVVLGAGVDVEPQLIVSAVGVLGLEAGHLGAAPRVLGHAGLVVRSEEFWPLRQGVSIRFTCLTKCH